MLSIQIMPSLSRRMETIFNHPPSSITSDLLVTLVETMPPQINVNLAIVAASTASKGLSAPESDSSNIQFLPAQGKEVAPPAPKSIIGTKRLPIPEPVAKMLLYPPCLRVWASTTPTAVIINREPIP